MKYVLFCDSTDGGAPKNPSGLNEICRLCVRECKQSAFVILHSCSRFSRQLTLDDELKAFNRRARHKPKPR